MLNKTSPANTFPEVIRAARNEMRLSLRDFAQELGVSHSAIDQWENGQSDIDAERVKSWLTDERVWVRVLGVRVFAVKFGSMLASASDTPKAA